MQKIQILEKWCLACHLCEVNCAFASTGLQNMAQALKGRTVIPRIRVEQRGDISFAVACRHCREPLCVKSCIAGALHKEEGAVRIDKEKCVGCYTCVLVCPFGAILPDENGVIQKCELCLQTGKTPACVEGCPNGALKLVDCAQ